MAPAQQVRCRARPEPGGGGPGSGAAELAVARLLSALAPPLARALARPPAPGTRAPDVPPAPDSEAELALEAAAQGVPVGRLQGLIPDPANSLVQGGNEGGLALRGLETMAIGLHQPQQFGQRPRAR